MGRKKAAASGGDDQDKTVKAADLMKMPDASDVEELAGELGDAREEHDLRSKAMSDRMADAKASQGIHPEAIKKVESLVNKAKGSDRGLAAVSTFLAHFDFYRDVLKLDELCASQGQLLKRDMKAPAGGLAAETPDEERDLRPAALRQADVERETGKPHKPH